MFFAFRIVPALGQVRTEFLRFKAGAEEHRVLAIARRELIDAAINFHKFLNFLKAAEQIRLTTLGPELRQDNASRAILFFAGKYFIKHFLRRPYHLKWHAGHSAEAQLKTVIIKILSLEKNICLAGRETISSRLNAGVFNIF